MSMPLDARRAESHVLPTKRIIRGQITRTAATSLNYEESRPMKELLHNYQQPQPPINGFIAPADHFRRAVQGANVGPDNDIPTSPHW
jgi:hypothetical protein